MKPAFAHGVMIISAVLFTFPAGCRNQADKFYDLGLYFEKREQYGQAAVEYQKALDQDPRHLEAQYHLGLALRGMEMITEAEEAFNKTLQLKPDHHGALAALGEIAYSHKDWKKAGDYASRLLQLEPESQVGLTIKAGVLLEEKKFPEAAACFEQVLRNRPDNAEIHYALAFAYLNIEEPDRTAEAIKELRTAETQGMDISKALNHFREELSKRGKNLEDYEPAAAHGAAPAEEGRQTVGQ